MTVLDTFRYTGMRNNQMIHIRLRDVNIEQGWIELRLEGSKTHREWKVPVVRQLRERIELLMKRAIERGAGQHDLLFDVKRFTNPRNTHYIYDEKTFCSHFVTSIVGCPGEWLRYFLTPFPSHTCHGVDEIPGQKSKTGEGFAGSP